MSTRLIIAALLLTARAWCVGSVTITDTSGGTQTNRPITISRVFGKGEIAAYAQPSIGGTPLSTWQCDKKNTWSDGSLKHALISFPVTLSANGSVTVDFVNNASASSSGSALTQAQMLSFNSSGWGADIEIANGATLTADARTMLGAGAWRYWLRGPVVTQVIVEDRTATLVYDLGWDAHKPLHPIFVLTFYAGWTGVKVESILENMWISKLEDQSYSLALKVGNPLGSAWYTKTTFTHYARTRWRKTTWSGTEPGAVSIDYNLPYLISSKAVANYDTTRIPDAAAITTEVNLFNATGKGDINDNALYAKDFGTTGGRQEIGLTPQWEAMYLLSGDAGLYTVTTKSGEVSGYVPVHYRETTAGANFGLPVSAVIRSSFSSLDPIGTGATAVGTMGSSGWIPDVSHQSAFAYTPYLLTGDWYWLEEMQFWAGWVSAYTNPGNCSYCRHGDWGIIGQTWAARGFAWGLRNMVHAWFFTPDDDSQQATFAGFVNNNLAMYEGKLGITTGTFNGNAQWTWGNTVVALDGDGHGSGKLPNPLGFLLYDSAATGGNQGIAASVEYADASFMHNFARAVLGRIAEWGFDAKALLAASGKELLHTVLDPAIANHYLAGAYHVPRTRASDSAWLQAWDEYYASFDATAKANTSWASQAPSANDTSSSCDGYPHLARVAAAYLQEHAISDGDYSGTAAHSWLAGNMSLACLDDNPMWAILPRDVAPEPPAASNGGTHRGGKLAVGGKIGW